MARCFAEVLRLWCPDTPYNDAELQVGFDLIGATLRDGLRKDDGDHFTKCFQLLESMAETLAPVVLCEMESAFQASGSQGSQESAKGGGAKGGSKEGGDGGKDGSGRGSPLHRFLSALADCVHADLSSNVCDALYSIFCSCVHELEQNECSLAMMELLICPLLKRVPTAVGGGGKGGGKKGGMVPASRFAGRDEAALRNFMSRVLKTTVGCIAHPVSMMLQEAVRPTAGKSAMQTSELTDDPHALVWEMHLIAGAADKDLFLCVHAALYSAACEQLRLLPDSRLLVSVPSPAALSPV